MLNLLLRVVEINNTGVTGHFLLPKNDFEHAHGPRDSAYAVNLTYDIYNWASEASPTYTVVFNRDFA